jgi:CIC family chloride channel protein
VTRDLPLRTLRERFPLGSTKRVFVVGENGEYLGMVDLVEAHAPDLDAKLDQLTAADLTRHQSDYMLPQANIKLALTRFMAAETESLAVLDNEDDRRVIGFVTEGYLLRRYSQELEKRGGGVLPGELAAELDPQPGPTHTRQR